MDVVSESRSRPGGAQTALAERVPPPVRLAGISPRTATHFITMRDLAANLLGLVAYKGAELGWTPLQIFVFQAPVRRIRDAAQAVIDRSV